jgi:hypothetical protein
VVVEGPQDRDARPAQGCVGAHVGLELDPHAEQLALLGGGHLHVLDDAAALDGGQVAFGAGLCPLDRLAELAGQGDGGELLGVDLQLGAEAAPDLGGDHPELGLGDPEAQGQEEPHKVGDLGGRPDGELALGGHRLDDDAARLDGVGDQPGVEVALLDDHRGLVEDPVDVAVAQLPGVELVAVELLVDDVGAFGHRLLDAVDHRQLVVVDLDRLGGVDGVLAAVGHDHGDDLAHVADPVLGHRPVVGDAGVLGRLARIGAAGHRPGTGHGRGPLGGDLLAGEHGHHPGQLLGRGGVDRGDVGVGDRAARERQPQHARQGDVVGVAALAGDQLGVLLAHQAATHPALGPRLGYLRHSDPPWTATGWAAAGSA